jgi:hypothetical protein
MVIVVHVLRWGPPWTDVNLLFVFSILPIDNEFRHFSDLSRLSVTLRSTLRTI